MEPSNKRFDVYIYKLDLNIEKPVIEKFSGQIRDIAYAGTEVIRWVGPNDYSVWHSSFDTCMLGVVYEPLDNVIELIVRRDGIASDDALILIQNYCCKKAAGFRKKLDMFHRGIGASTEAYVQNGRNLY